MESKKVGDSDVTDMNEAIEEVVERTVNGLKKRGFEAWSAKDRFEACKLILDLIPGDGIVCVGDSSTVRQTRVVSALRSRGNRIINPFDPDKKIIDERTFYEFLFKPSLDASLGDVFLTGTNAVTEDGKLLNIDGAGNRVAGMFWGHPLSILVVGKNKIVKDLDEAFQRVKNVVSPEHISRRGGGPPCAVTGECHDCSGPKRVCAVTTILEHKPILTDIHVVIVDEDLGLSWDRSWPEERIARIAAGHEKFSWSVPKEVMEKVDRKRLWGEFLSSLKDRSPAGM
jgi:L-lactate utilization protein LutB